MSHETNAKGYGRETAAKYTEGQKQFFEIDKVLDGATLAMEAEIGMLAEQYTIHTICDIGCGSNCAYLETWKNAAHATHLVGVEPSEHMRTLLEERLHDFEDADSIEVVSGDWTHVPLTADSVDLVVSRFSLHHLQHIRDGYAELARILKINGHAVISLPHPEYCAAELAKNGIAPQEGMPMSVQVFDTTLSYCYHEMDAYIGDNLRESGLELVKTESFNWGTKDDSEKQTPNTLLFVVRKVNK